MNPFTGALTRIGFLLWSLLASVSLYILLIARNRGSINIGEGSSVAGMLAAYFLIAAFIALSLLLVVRRLQSAKMPIWLALLYFVPVAGFVFWFALFFIPPKPA